ncbi:Protein kinase domain-containing protein [Caenorhabditis elegans]|uniref:Protein kinase domain-containing protein n=1 Tax=Caenorhabditis elegans TaxID=6239 RepID=P91191_CAEEL|nr:Protein kinase domain-containing protein [Caenorhabditis elegans]CCD68080.1 Protein kinase domain-containing protein [Caenorhabditis elegans]|eukprot:NP_509211.2 Uncharacterized protein CELE_C55B6.5 [Caenorhabditis elegans]
MMSLLVKDRLLAKQYKLTTKIGAGDVGQVWQCTDRLDENKLKIVKIINKYVGGVGPKDDSFANEVEFYKKCLTRRFNLKRTQVRFYQNKCCGFIQFTRMRQI